VAQDISIQLLSPDPLEEARLLLSTAFSDDPIAAYIFPQRSLREERLPRIMGADLLLGFRCGKVLGAFSRDSGQLIGTVTWLPPQRVLPSYWDLIQVLRSMKKPRKVYSFGAGLRAWKVTSTLRMWHPRNFKHWHVTSLAVSPTCRRKGVGAALVRHGLEWVDRDKVCAYAVTAHPESGLFFASLGFQLWRKFDAGKSLPFWTFARPPLENTTAVGAGF
jgi:ribosomal protein S18 acetylase RimI-like enzyme